MEYDRDYGDENDYRNDDDFYLDTDWFEDENEDFDEEAGGALVPNEPRPSDPFLSASAIVEKEYVFA